MLGALADLVLRRDCVCCGRVVADVPCDSTPRSPAPAGLAFGRDVCAPCVQELSRPWQQWFPPTAVAPVFAAGAYGSARRTLVISAKDRLRPAAIALIGRVFGAGLGHVAVRGIIPDPRWGKVALLPAPTRRSSAKQRGGDIVVRAALETKAWVDARGGIAPGAGVGVFQTAYLGEHAQDSVGLGRAERQQNISRNLELNAYRVNRVREFLVPRKGVPTAAVIVDDVCTTGATASQFALGLASSGVDVAAVLVVAGA